MCLTFFRFFKVPNKYQLILAFNREQATLRETLPFGPFAEDPNIFAGRDTVSGGTWLGINIKTGLIVILTNYDTPELIRLKSRGQLVYKFLSTQTFSECKKEQIDNKVVQLLKNIEEHQEQFSPFNLSIYNVRSNRMFYLNNQTKAKIRELQKDTNYGLCNIDIDTLWDKTAYGLEKFASIIKQDCKESQYLIEKLEQLMRDDKAFSEDPEKESAIFVHPYYSYILDQQRRTKSTTIILIDKQLHVQVKEVSYGGKAKTIHTKLSLV